MIQVFANLNGLHLFNGGNDYCKDLRQFLASIEAGDSIKDQNGNELTEAEIAIVKRKAEENLADYKLK